jgi:hypothetical protein
VAWSGVGCCQDGLQATMALTVDVPRYFVPTRFLLEPAPLCLPLTGGIIVIVRSMTDLAAFIRSRGLRYNNQVMMT